MAVKAKAEITLTSVVDIVSVTRYYLLQSSTTAAPGKPSANPPGGSWSTSEPTYVSGSTNTLYSVDCTEYTNGTFSYSTVSKSSSYEAAKAAYNKAVSAENIANGIEIGGRNLIIGRDVTHGFLINSTHALDVNSGAMTSDYIPVTPGDSLILQYWTERATSVTGSDRAWHHKFAFFASDFTYLSGYESTYISEYHTVVYGVVPANAAYVRVSYLLPVSDDRADIVVNWRATDADYKWKLEVGTKPTDWSIAPEDSATTESVSDAVESVMQVLEDRISMLVRGADGSSLMQQTDDGWIFAMGDTLAEIESVIQGLSNLSTSVNDLDTAVDEHDQTIGALQTVTDKLSELTAYIRMVTEDDKPVLELGNASTFRTRITNEALEFMDGDDCPAYISNKSLMINRAEIQRDLTFGGFAWIIQGNGNMGLTWRGDV